MSEQFTVAELREAFEYLDELREGGRTNMFGAAAYVERELGWRREDASSVTRLWMATFSHTDTMEQRIAAAQVSA